jgi:hypothetical protein
LVFPFALYFVEAVSSRIYALPFNQFLIEKREMATFQFVDLTGKYHNHRLRDQVGKP